MVKLQLFCYCFSAVNAYLSSYSFTINTIILKPSLSGYCCLTIKVLTSLSSYTFTTTIILFKPSLSSYWLLLSSYKSSYIFVKLHLLLIQLQSSLLAFCVRLLLSSYQSSYIFIKQLFSRKNFQGSLSSGCCPGIIFKAPLPSYCSTVV